ncbi:TIGR00730 family Rossman fold protein [Paenibacillus farraposensis]|uniref:Cytokinin riboside 5'-monophosphate phosphoribohydrolase n=1 Tax=Paenibacillus farraposensis TaxID=2807095 RepID=A0ABW4DER2_9BACL|nr:TIGR00730 family Rossman fold protein [Paenibacillus farraposensis]MCC3379352.1 TIGR00730 family Rossman fold protein [Paenibacillus farraposensis]
MNSICVFAGSRPGHSSIYLEAAGKLGEAMARHHVRLIYGGSSRGLMGEVANGMLAGGGQVTGIMPTLLFDAEIIHRGINEFVEVANMHERKAVMSDMADAFIALPGGLGTFEELFEVLCWAQIGIHRKPIGLLNVSGYFDPLVEMVRHSVKEGFAGAEHPALLSISADPDELLHMLKNKAEDLK